LLGLGRLVLAPQSKQTKKNDNKIALMKKVTMLNGVATITTIEGEKEEDTISHTKGLAEYNKEPWVPLTYEDIHAETVLNFWMCVIEDLNTILCYAFVVRACDAQSAIHDDSTTFFDVTCIVFLGFLQHVANILMVFHTHAEKQGILEKTAQKEIDEVMLFIARTRMLLFSMIFATLVCFCLRVAPTYEQFSISILYTDIRITAIVTMFLLNTAQSAVFEAQNSIQEVRKQPWDSSPKWKHGALSFIALVFCIGLYSNTTIDKDGSTRQKLHEFAFRTEATASGASTTTTAAPTTTPPPPLSK
jgi:hypothetical protein